MEENQAPIAVCDTVVTEENIQRRKRRDENRLSGQRAV